MELPFSITLRRAAFRSYFASANFVTIPTRIMRAPATTTNKLEREKKQAASETKKESDHVTHPQDPATVWRCFRAVASPPRRPPEVGL
jgi:hypothetical protein